MTMNELWETVRDTTTVRRVYGEPLEHDGVVLLPAAAIRGVGGGGEGRSGKGDDGAGGGFGVTARPVGAYVIKNGTVTWRPVVDVERLVMWLGAALVAASLSIRRSSRR